MENASKALIIAGAILLSILIIALGMRVYNSANAAVAGADLSDTEVQAFNAKFEAYDGEQKGSSVRALISAVNNINQNNPDRTIAIINATQRAAGVTLEGLVGDSDLIQAVKEHRRSIVDETGNDPLSDGTGYTVSITQSQIETNKTYKVGFIYDDNGTVVAVIIR